VSGRQSVRHGRAIVSWGPVTYGADRITANCPVDAFPDLVVAARIACEQWITSDETRDGSGTPNPGQPIGPESPPVVRTAPGINIPNPIEDYEYALRNAVG
jgi:hypothetical protein